MPGPMFVNGNLLFTSDGKLAMDPNCCCNLTCATFFNCMRCSVGPPAVYRQIELVVSGVTNGTCVQCTNLNGTYIASIFTTFSLCYLRYVAVPSSPACSGALFVDIGTTTPGNWNFSVFHTQVTLLWSFSTTALAEAAIRSLCAGNTVTIPFTVANPDCLGSLATVTVRLLPC